MDRQFQSSEMQRAEVAGKTLGLLKELVEIERENGKLLTRIAEVLEGESNLNMLRGQSPLDRP
jgi:hypothetical protein